MGTANRLGFYQIPYTVFHTTERTPALPQDALTAARQRALGTMGGFSALVLELAATAVYLKEHGYRESYWDEVKRRKPLKASPERVGQAKQLLMQLDLEPT